MAYARAQLCVPQGHNFESGQNGALQGAEIVWIF